MIKFVALGGTVDPTGERPSIGGSAYCFYDDQKRHALLIGFGAYNPPDDVRTTRTGSSLQDAQATEFVAAGDHRIGIFPRMRDLVLTDTENSSGFLPFYDILEEADRIDVIGDHGHSDHIGALPWLRGRFPGKVSFYMTEATRDLCRWSYNDHLKVSNMQGLETLYSVFNVQHLFEEIRIVKPFDELNLGVFRAMLYPAGHIIGATSVLMLEPIRVFFTGDISFHEQYTVKGAELPAKDIAVDYLFSEATYAGKDGMPRESVERTLAEDARRHLSYGGKVVEVALSIGRIQENFMNLERWGIVDDYPVYIDGSGCDTTQIYFKHGAVPDRMLRHFITTREEREKILRSSRPLVVISPNGMLRGGPAVAYALEWGNQSETLIALTNFQHPCSPGGRLLNISPGERFIFDDRGTRRTIKFNARVKQYPLSAHMNRNDLVNLVDYFKPKATYLVHGEESGMLRARAGIGATVHPTYVQEIINLG